MDICLVMRIGAATALLAAGSVLAQSSGPSAQSAPSSGVPSPPVMVDTEPLPAEERDSLGAIVLENSMVRAQREAFAAARHTSLRVSSVGRGVIRADRRARTKDELQQQREDESIRLHEMGAGSLTPR